MLYVSGYPNSVLHISVHLRLIPPTAICRPGRRSGTFREIFAISVFARAAALVLVKDQNVKLALLSVSSSVTMVMGIPTVKRKVKSYLSETLRSLIDKLSPEEKLDCVIIVFVGEVRPRVSHSMSHTAATDSDKL